MRFVDSLHKMQPIARWKINKLWLIGLARGHAEERPEVSLKLLYQSRCKHIIWC